MASEFPEGSKRGVFQIYDSSCGRDRSGRARMGQIRAEREGEADHQLVQSDTGGEEVRADAKARNEQHTFAGTVFQAVQLLSRAGWVQRIGFDKHTAAARSDFN